jgi:hypothetical protein
MQTNNTRVTEPLRLVTDELVEQTESARAEQLARVARQLVGDPRLGITQVRIHGPRCDETYSAEGECVVPEQAAPPVAAGRRALSRFRAFRAHATRER